MSERKAAEQLHAHRDDADEWEDAPASVKVKQSRTEVVSFRLPSDELDRLEEAAAAAGETISVFIRRVLQQHLGGLPPSLQVTSGALRLFAHGSNLSQNYVEPAVAVPDYPPSLSNISPAEQHS